MSMPRWGGGVRGLVLLLLLLLTGGCAQFVASQVIDEDPTRVAAKAEALVAGSSTADGFKPGAALDILSLHVVSLAYGDVSKGFLIVVLSDAGVPSKQLEDARHRLISHPSARSTHPSSNKKRGPKLRLIKSESKMVEVQGNHKEAVFHIEEDDSGSRLASLQLVLNDPTGKQVACLIVGEQKNFPEKALQDFLTHLKPAPLSPAELASLPPALDSISSEVEQGPRDGVIWLEDDRMAYKIKGALRDQQVEFKLDGGSSSHEHRLGEPIKRTFRLICEPVNKAKLPALVKTLKHRGFQPVGVSADGQRVEVGEAQDRAIYDLREALTKEDSIKPWIAADEIKIEPIQDAPSFPQERWLFSQLSHEECSKLQVLLRENGHKGGTWYPSLQRKRPQ